MILEIIVGIYKESTITTLYSKNLLELFICQIYFSLIKTIRISENLWKSFVQHSRRYYNVESYEIILSNLLDDFDKHNPDKYRYNNIGIDK